MSGKKDWEILGVDHVAFAVKDIDSWVEKYKRVFGGEQFYYVDDANPDGASSMKLAGVRLDNNVTIALIEGIDREEISQVTKYVKRHGDHSPQHPALAVRNIETLVKHLHENGAKFMSELLQRKDMGTGGDIKQIFACPFDSDLDPDEAPFFEFVERPQVGESFTSGDSFDDRFAQGLFQDVEKAAASGQRNSFLPREECS